MRRTFLGTALAVTSLYLLVPTFAFEISSSPALDALSQQGKQLRADLWEIYKDSKEKAKSPSSGIDVSSTVTKYIPIGMSFDDAERILIGAGFKMGPRPPHPIQKESIVKYPEAFRFAWFGELDLDQTFRVSKTSVSVTLFPDAPDNPNARAKEIQALLHTTYL